MSIAYNVTTDPMVETYGSFIIKWTTIDLWKLNENASNHGNI